MGVAIRVIPCLDVDNGRVVKGVNFENLRDAGDPVELAKRYGEEGADELTFLDVTASTAGRGTMLDVVRRTAEQVFIPLTVGGGVRSVDDVRELLRAGADKVSVNTAAIANPGLIRELAEELGIEVPATWEDFTASLKTIKDAGLDVELAGSYSNDITEDTITRLDPSAGSRIPVRVPR